MTYTKVKEIGAGSFGIVDHVVDENGIEWARKTFRPPAIPGVSPQEIRQRFDREVRYQSQLDHPNIVRIEDSDLVASPPWFTMRLAECSLADELAVDRTLAKTPGKPLFDILAGLEEMHKRGFRHRDLKPANVLKFISEDGSYRYAISDFGLMAPDIGQTSTLTASQMGGGTRLYCAPECAINFKRATTQSDIYSFGAILHDIFAGGTGRIPHSELDCAGPLGEIVKKCTKKNLHRRYKNVAELREDLYKVLSTETLQFFSNEEKEIVELLGKKEILSDDDWDRVFEQIDDNTVHQRTNHNIFRAITLNQITQLTSNAPALFSALGEDFADYIRSGIFDFSYCDVLAAKGQLFYDNGELELQARIAVGMLRLGVSHNRWLVEHRFMAMAGGSVPDELAQRIAIELEVAQVDFKRNFEHLRHSIGAQPAQLHPVLQGLLGPDIP